ncbi:MAG: hypothetical protein EBT34_06245, partial [Acetobacteraceae bacterium]|nr:hypothetical protein [Acetobacteraceae bacterium]
MKAAPRGFGLVASVALHGFVVAALIFWPMLEDFSTDQAEAQGIAVKQQTVTRPQSVDGHGIVADLHGPGQRACVLAKANPEAVPGRQRIAQGQHLHG